MCVVFLVMVRIMVFRVLILFGSCRLGGVMRFIRVYFVLVFLFF